jgi:hypothetical protein
MMKRSHFEEFIGPGWPVPIQLERYFLGPASQRWPFEDSTDCWGFSALGVDGTEHLHEGGGRIDIRVTMVGNRYHGVLLFYRKYGGESDISCYSKGNLRRLREWVETVDGDLLPVGLFIPFETAWTAVKEFLEKDGFLPTCIEWIASSQVERFGSPNPQPV